MREPRSCCFEIDDLTTFRCSSLRARAKKGDQLVGLEVVEASVSTRVHMEAIAACENGWICKKFRHCLFRLIVFFVALKFLVVPCT